VLNNTQGVDLRSYLQTVEKILKIKWYNLIPESARPPIMIRGQVVIEFAILKDGKIAGMKLVSGSGDVALDRGAWGAITASNPLPSPPPQFTGSALTCACPSITTPIPIPRSGSGYHNKFLSEILIAPPQPSSSARIGEAQPKAQELLDAIRQGGRFADVAQANSQGPTAAKGGDLGYFDHGKLAPSIEEIAFQLKVGDVSDVIPTKQGFAILQVTERPAADDVSLEVPKQPITAELGAYLAEVTQKVGQSLDKIVLESTVPSENKQGDVTIQFLMERNGAISRSKVTSRAGNTELDDAALNAIRAVGPLSPLPSATKTHHLVLRVHFHRSPVKTTGSAIG